MSQDRLLNVVFSIMDAPRESVGLVSKIKGLGLLLKLLSDPDREIRERTAYGLSDRVLDSSRPRNERCLMLHTLARSGHECLIGTASTVLSAKSDPDLMTNAAFALRWVRRESRSLATAELVQAYDPRLPEKTKCELIVSLGFVGEAGDVKYLDRWAQVEAGGKVAATLRSARIRLAGTEAAMT